MDRFSTFKEISKIDNLKKWKKFQKPTLWQSWTALKNVIIGQNLQNLKCSIIKKIDNFIQFQKLTKFWNLTFVNYLQNFENWQSYKTLLNFRKF